MEMRAKAGRVMHSGNLNKEKRKLRVGSVLDHGALSFHSRFFVVEPGLLSWWAEEAEQVASQPPKGTMVLDKMTAISNNKSARVGNQFAFRVDRASAWSKWPLDSAAAQLLCLLRARLAALGSSALPGRGRPTGRPATASGAREPAASKAAAFTASDHVDR